MTNRMATWLVMSGVMSLILSVNSTQADIVITGRSSEIIYNYVYGFAASSGDYYSGNGNPISTLLVPSDSFEHHFSDSKNGFYQPTGVNWSASAQIDIVQAFSISLFPTGVNQITASGATALTTSTSGVGSDALINSVNPGNELEIYFTVTDTRSFNLSGSVASSQANTAGSTRIAIEYNDGFGWTYGPFDSWLYLAGNGSVGSFDFTGTLTPGNYRLVGISANQVLGNQSNSSSFNYTFSSIPEPTATLALCAVLGASAWRRRRNG